MDQEKSKARTTDPLVEIDSLRSEVVELRRAVERLARALSAEPELCIDYSKVVEGITA